MTQLAKRSPEGKGPGPRPLSVRLRGVLRRFADRRKNEGKRHRYLHSLNQNVQLSPEDLHGLQLKRLRQTLEWAGQHVPYYRDLFASHGFKPESVQSQADLHTLPRLTKAIIREQGSRMMAEPFVNDPSLARTLLERRTGGSTGEPLVFQVDRDSFEWQHAANLRAYRLMDVAEGDRVAKIWGYGDKLPSNAVPWLTGRYYLDAFDTSPHALELWYESLVRFQPRAIYGYASAIFRFARHLQESGRTLPSLDVIITTAEKLFPEARETIERAFGVAVCDVYGCHEVVRLAWECREGNMHVASDIALLEFTAPATGANVQSGHGAEDGKPILITSFHSAAMPLIRYDVGDSAMPLDHQCPCGLPFPLMKIGAGKVHQIFVLGGGKEVHTTVFTKVLWPIEHLQGFQVRQTARDEVELLGVPRSGATAAASSALEAAAVAVRKELGESARIVPRLMDEIPITPRGKRPTVLSLVD